MDSQFLVILLLLAVTSFVLLFFIKQQVKAKAQARRLPPGPRKLPLIGNLHQLLGDGLQNSLLRLAKQYGPLMFVQLGSVPAIVVSSADVTKEIFKKHDINFSGRPELYAAKKLTYNRNNISFAPYGENWREVRKIATLELLTSKRVQSLQAVRDQEVELMLDFIARNSSAPLNLTRLTVLLSNSVVCRAIFGKRFHNESDEGISKFDAVLRDTRIALGKFNVADFYPWLWWINRFNGEDSKLEKIFQVLDSLYEVVIQEHRDPGRRNKAEHEDFIDVFLQIQKDPNQSITIRNEQVKGVLTDMFIAGTGTTARTLEWVVTELIRNPLVMRRAQDEVREAAKGKLKVEENDLSKLVYMKAILKETLRIHPPAPLAVPRETLEDCTVAGYQIPAKTRVYMDSRLIGKDSSYWENPDKFIPERFLNSSIDFKGQHFGLIPFGAGRRGCPGINFGVQLVELALANLLHRFDWKLPDGMRLEDLAMEEVFGVEIKNKKPLSLVATPFNLNV